MRAHANAHSKGYPFARSTVRHTVASHDMQHIDLCEADSMLADSVARGAGTIVATA